MTDAKSRRQPITITVVNPPTPEQIDALLRQPQVITALAGLVRAWEEHLTQPSDPAEVDRAAA
jgi:hypothetical protein